jgi:hypothetical protein
MSYYQPPQLIVTKTRKDTSHAFHLIMTIMAFGMWGVFVWIPITIWHSMGPREKSVGHANGVAYPQYAPNAAQQHADAYRYWYYNQYLPWAQSRQRQALPPRR